jgi:pimeloyl-ACP methyl ester carboxylesterase
MVRVSDEGRCRVIENIQLDGLNVRVTRLGTGPQIVYLHSGNGELGDFPFARELVDHGYSVIAPEFPGFGKSDIDPTMISIEDGVFRTNRVLRALGVDRAAALCGSSFGGWLAAELLVWWHDLADSLVLVDAAGLHLPEHPAIDIFFYPPEQTMQAANPHGVDYMAALAPAIGEAMDEVAIMTHFIKAQAAVARVGWSPYLHDPKLPARLQTVSQPTLVIWGEEDGLIPPEHGRKYADLLPNATLTTIPYTGHLPALEKPRETAALVAEFVSAHHSARA